MKILALIIILSSLCGLPAQAGGVDPGIREKVLAAKAEAIEAIRIYSMDSKYDQHMRKIAAKTADLLEKSSTIPAVGMALESCNEHPSAVAGTDGLSGVIALCQYGLDSTKNDLIQTFIHEAYHLYDGVYYIPQKYPAYYNEVKLHPEAYKKYPQIVTAAEKRAATFELEIMLKIYKCVFSETSYFKDLLHLQKGRDFTVCK
jgi:hypothetical protein